VSELDPRKFDWPIPEPGSPEEEALNEPLQYAAEGIQEDLRHLPPGRAADFIELLTICFDDSPAPVESVSALERLFSHQSEYVEEFVSLALAHPAAFRRAFKLLGHSRWLGAFLARGAWRDFLAASEEDLQATVTRQSAAGAVRMRIAAGEDVLTALRVNHYQHILRVLYHEVFLKRPVDVIAREISELADAALEVALEQAFAALESKRDLKPAPDFKLCVIAMGKHGANELNYSSDIDLLFVFEGAGPGRMDAQAYAVKLCETLIPLIDSATEHGHVFRVDTRLRPEGKRGRLAREFSATVDYYYSFGATWERQALIKARACAGDIAFGERLLDRLQGWIYRKYLTLEEINQIKSLKRRIEQRTEQRDENFRDVKTGFGGIRDIEYVTQFLQLMNGGRMPEVRERATLPALHALARAGALKRSEADALADAYRFLRSVEHRLQVWDGFQTHALPADPQELRRVGRAMGYTGDGMAPARMLVGDLQRHTMKARGLMLRLFADLFTQGAPAESELVLDPDMTAEQAAPTLAKHGFADTNAAFRAIRDLSRESADHAMYEARARKYLASMMPALLEFCGASADADFSLHNFERITGALGAKAILFELVAEDPRALSIFGSIAAQSNWLTEILVRRPGLVDEFIDELQTFHSLDRGALRRQLAERMQAAVDVTDALYWQHDVELLRIGLFDLTGRTPLPETLRELCALSEVLIDACLDVSISEIADRSDTKLKGDPADHLAVIGMGKLGSGAMNYASDLDLVFAYDPGAFEDAGAAQSFYSKVVRRLLSLLGASGERGKLYEVDLRLRPRGGKGALAVTLDELRGYLATEAGFWERLAGCRARVLNPDASGGAAAKAIFEDFVYKGADAQQTLAMRERLERESQTSPLKRGAGGTLDIEFLLAHLQLKHADKVPALKQADLWEVLHVARDAGIVDARSFDTISGAYAYLRAVVNRLQILDGQSRHELPKGPEIEVFARRMGYRSSGGLSAADQLTEELNWHRRAAREMFTRFVM
jgi:glutamate-ammonia-ligase adenylyltransferase